jgi:hypothetical protein
VFYNKISEHIGQNGTMWLGAFCVLLLVLMASGDPLLVQHVGSLGRRRPAMFLLGAAALGALVFVGGALLLDRNYQNAQHVPAPLPPITPQLERNKLHIFFARASGYRDATDGPKEDAMHRHIVSSEPFRLSSQERVFAWGIDNENDGIALRNARLNFYYYGKVPIQITRTHLDEEGHHWHEYSTGTHYFYDFTKPINARWAHSWGALIIKFPEAGEYRFDLAATGDEIIGDPLKTYLRVIVAESAFHKRIKK